MIGRKLNVTIRLNNDVILVKPNMINVSEMDYCKENEWDGIWSKGLELDGLWFDGNEWGRLWSEGNKMK